MPRFRVNDVVDVDELETFQRIKRKPPLDKNKKKPQKVRYRRCNDPFDREQFPEYN